MGGDARQHVAQVGEGIQSVAFRFGDDVAAAAAIP
jgi:hypothetical protein